MTRRGRSVGKALVGTLVLVTLGAQGSKDTESATGNSSARSRGITSPGSDIERRFLEDKPDVSNKEDSMVAATDLSQSSRDGERGDIEAEREWHGVERGSEKSMLDPGPTSERQLDQEFANGRPASRECPYAVYSEEEAIARVRDQSIPGNIVIVEHLRFCRTGNHFSSVFRNLALGYCCKSKMVMLPPKDDVLAPGVFNEGTPGPRWFDFSSAPDVSGFDSGTCKTHITWAGPRAFRMNQLEDPRHEHYNPPLLGCIRTVPRLLACEAAYYFPTDVDVCPDREHAGNGDMNEQKEENEKRRLGSGLGEAEGGKDEGADESEGGKDGRPAGNLVFHVRSGDIFDDAVLSYYGQPPLQFYLHVIQDQKWDRVDVLTNALNAETLNPVVPALKIKQAIGEIPSNVYFHTDRSMEEDLRSMMCADALGMARSTLVTLTSFHSTASRIYAPMECDKKLTQLAKFRPEAKVYGLSWPKNYTVYSNWKNTSDQREEMLVYNSIKGLMQCTGQ